MTILFENENGDLRLVRESAWLSEAIDTIVEDIQENIDPDWNWGNENCGWMDASVHEDGNTHVRIRGKNLLESKYILLGI